MLTRAFMLARARARDRRYDGVFLTCVRSTGIYCLPSCKAKSPKPENVEHWATPAEAQAAGFRACLRCRPDDHYAGRDVDRDALLSAATALRATPGDFDGVPAFAAKTGCGVTKLTALCKQHLHLLPADVILRARVATACDQLAHSRARVLDIALDAGFMGSSAFHLNFRAHTGLTPRAFRQMLAGRTFALQLPPRLAVSECLRYAARDPDGISERLVDGVLTLALSLAGRAGAVTIERGRTLRCAVAMADGKVPGRDAMLAAHAAVTRLLHLGCDSEAAERRLQRASQLRPLLRARPGVRPWLCSTPFQALLWAVLGQQVHLAFAHRLRAAVTRRAGERIGDLVALPEAAAVARLDASDLVADHCSRQKAESLLAAARAVHSGAVDLDALATTAAGTADAALQQLRGVGPWTSQYVLMRGFGLLDCLPVGDSALATAAAQVFGLPRRPDGEQLVRLAQPFAPHRTLLCFHLWRSLADAHAPLDSRARNRKPGAPVSAAMTP
jgi:AraC family transcriptional regulator of adaptative response / DNA-3-methyladenine glycosylase II